MNQKPDKLIPALYGGIIMALVSSIPLLNLVNCLCCAGIMLGGFFAVYFYKSNFTPDTPSYTSGDCIGVGALAGVFGAVIGTVLSAIVTAIMGDFMKNFIMRIIESYNVDLPNDFWDQMEVWMSKETRFLSIVMEFFTNLIIYPLFGLLGGLIGYNIYKPKIDVMPPPPMMPPQ